MSNRITIKHLCSKVDTLNDIFGYAREPYATERDSNGNLTTNAGTFTLDCAYGGYRLCQMCNGGGERDITGRASARETHDLISAFIKGAMMMRAKQ